ncbi:hypothetical protein QYZ87_09220 [Porphyromonadaceae bacterium W3.11]|nr:hypothetical protein [Porphyromonadaceae bacterium W3.11]
MKSKITVLIVNGIYLIGTVIWAFKEASAESFVAILGGFVSLASFFVGNDNSFVIKNKNCIEQEGSSSNAVIGDVSGSNIGNTTNVK